MLHVDSQGTDARGFGWLSEDDFSNHFAADVDPTRAKVLYAVQQALAKSKELAAGEMGKLTEGLNLPPGMGF